MGILASFDIYDIGLPEETPAVGIYIDYSDGFLTFCEVFYDTARALVPVDTGYLQSSIGYETDGESCVCYADADYAQYVEYGTCYMGDQPFFEPALSEAFDAAMPLWEDAIQLAMEEEEEALWEMSTGEGSGGLRTAAAEMVLVNGPMASIGTMLGILGVMLIAAFVIATINFFQSEISSHFGQYVDEGGWDYSLMENFNIEIY